MDRKPGQCFCGAPSVHGIFCGKCTERLDRMASLAGDLMNQMRDLVADPEFRAKTSPEDLRKLAAAVQHKPQ